MIEDEETGQPREVLVLYEGEYRLDVKDGYGEYRWASGNLYKGYYKSDKRHYYGEMSWNDGSVYKGEWYEGV
jgi:MORN repeat